MRGHYYPGDWLYPLAACVVFAGLCSLCAGPADAGILRFEHRSPPVGVTYEACTAAGCVTGPVTISGPVAEIEAKTPGGAIAWVEAVGYGQRVPASNKGIRVGACAWDLDANGLVGGSDFGAARGSGLLAILSDFGAFRRVYGEPC